MSKMSACLGIVIPYRARQEHLDILLPHLYSYFSSDVGPGESNCRILIVEQTAGLSFNRGMIKNIGYRYLSKDVDYICFHDVDLLPITADYQSSEQPMMIAFHGLDRTPEFVRNLFGGVILMKNAQFEAANGYSNRYREWGFEDVDLRERLLRCNLQPGHREGVFRKLPHVPEGNLPDGTPSPAFINGQQLYIEQWFRKVGTGWSRQPNPAGSWREDGLNSLAFQEIVPRVAIASRPEKSCIVERVVVSLTYQDTVSGASGELPPSGVPG